MKYINLTKDDISVVYTNHYPTKVVTPGSVVNISKNKYDNLKNKDLKSLGLTPTNNYKLEKFKGTPKYLELISMRAAVKPTPEPKQAPVIKQEKASKKNK